MFSDTNSLTTHLVYLGDKELMPSQIVDLSLERSMDTLSSQGSVTFNDHNFLYSKLPITKETSLKLYLTDHFGTNINIGDYKILNVVETRSEQMGGNVVTITFVDKFYYHGIQAHISKGYISKPLKDILTALIGEVDIGLMKLDLTGEDTFIYPDLATPRDRNILQVITKLAEDRGLYLFRTKTTLKLKSIKELLSAPLDPRAKFRETFQERDLQRIISKESKSTSLIDSLIEIPEAKSFLYDIQTKSVVPKDIKKKEIHQDYKIESKLTVVENPKPDQERYIYNIREDENKIKSKYGNVLMDNVGLTVLVNGNFNIDVGSMVEVIIYDADPEKKKEEYKPLTGKYLVHGCLDKISTGYYVQKLQLIRADEKE